MSREKKKKDEKEFDPPEIDFLNINSTVSSSECTGLMRNVPDSKYDLESYEQLYELEIPSKLQDKKEVVKK